MSGIRINLVPPPEPSLEVRPAPRECLARWRSKYDDQIQHDRPTIFVTQTAFDTLNQHGARTLNLEVGGMLIGHAYRSPAQDLYVVVEGALEAQHVDHGPLHLTFTSDALADMHSRLEQSNPDKQIVGWYHTHPGLSIFLSLMDTWLHTHFFRQPWHVALVVDPQARHGGFFSYTTGKPAHLDPRAYTGFYELGEAGANSIVTWLNLKPEMVEFAGAFWEPVETLKD